ncbi:MAG: hypothetical protein Q9227_008913 [Pyrenula ochraceoflavens]
MATDTNSDDDVIFVSSHEIEKPAREPWEGVSASDEAQDTKLRLDDGEDTPMILSHHDLERTTEQAKPDDSVLQESKNTHDPTGFAAGNQEQQPARPGDNQAVPILTKRDETTGGVPKNKHVSGLSAKSDKHSQVQLKQAEQALGGKGLPIFPSTRMKKRYEVRGAFAATTDTKAAYLPTRFRTVARFPSSGNPAIVSDPGKCVNCGEFHHEGGDCVYIGMMIDETPIFDENTTSLFVRPHSDNDCALLGWTIWNSFQRAVHAFFPKYEAPPDLRDAYLKLRPSDCRRPTKYVTHHAIEEFNSFIKWFRQEVCRPGTDWNLYITISFGLKLEDVHAALQDTKGFVQFCAKLEGRDSAELDETTAAIKEIESRLESGKLKAEDLNDQILENLVPIGYGPSQ